MSNKKSVKIGTPKEGILASSNNWKHRSVNSKHPEPILFESLAHNDSPFEASISVSVYYLYVPKDVAYSEQPYDTDIQINVRNINVRPERVTTLANLEDPYTPNITISIT